MYTLIKKQTRGGAVLGQRVGSIQPRCQILSDTPTKRLFNQGTPHHATKDWRKENNCCKRMKTAPTLSLKALGIAVEARYP